MSLLSVQQSKHRSKITTVGTAVTVILLELVCPLQTKIPGQRGRIDTRDLTRDQKMPTNAASFSIR